MSIRWQELPAGKCNSTDGRFIGGGQTFRYGRCSVAEGVVIYASSPKR